mmetsp:Transcript_23097/g.61926  ORF Transcript_23097/g.61926 Transcript_23097/m.61926 type:complete len:215 (-) Transcript_23097:165-809(-)
MRSSSSHDNSWICLTFVYFGSDGVLLVSACCFWALDERLACCFWALDERLAFRPLPSPASGSAMLPLPLPPPLTESRCGPTAAASRLPRDRRRNAMGVLLDTDFGPLQASSRSATLASLLASDCSSRSPSRFSNESPVKDVRRGICETFELTSAHLRVASLTFSPAFSPDAWPRTRPRKNISSDATSKSSRGPIFSIRTGSAEFQMTTGSPHVN